MEDTLSCPVCGNKLRNNHLTKRHLHVLDKTANFVERTCTLGHNHSLRFFTDKDTGKVDLLKVSITPFTRFIEINYVLNKCRISCLKDQKTDYIDIEKILEPDFPDLAKLRERVNIYVVFS